MNKSASSPANANEFGRRLETAVARAAAAPARASIPGMRAAPPDYLSHAISLRRQVHTYLNNRLKEHKNTREPYTEYISKNPGKNALNAVLNTPFLHEKVKRAIYIPEEQKELARQYKAAINLAATTRRGRTRARRNRRKTRKL